MYGILEQDYDVIITLPAEGNMDHVIVMILITPGLLEKHRQDLTA